jgi:hypothetical protein
MWEHINDSAPAIQAIAAAAVGLLTLALVGATFWYVRLTRTIAESSVAQAEAMHKPVVTFQRDDAVSAPSVDPLDDVHRTKSTSPLILINIGTGPALKVNWRIRREPHNEPIDGFTSYIEAGKTVSTHLSGHLGGLGTEIHIDLECGYESVSGTKYVSATHLENMKITGFNTRKSA